jgi:hypothetical protein
MRDWPGESIIYCLDLDSLIGNPILNNQIATRSVSHLCRSCGSAYLRAHGCVRQSRSKAFPCLNIAQNRNRAGLFILINASQGIGTVAPLACSTDPITATDNREALCRDTHVRLLPMSIAVSMKAAAQHQPRSTSSLLLEYRKQPQELT